jgi:transcriptional regulator with XRE-family HTH domain
MKTEKTLKLFGKRLQTLRKSKGMRQAELAEKANLNSWEQISKIERGVSSTNLRTLISLASALEIAPADMLDLELEDVKGRGKSEAIKEHVAFLLKQDEAFILYTHEQAKLATEHWKKK